MEGPEVFHDSASVLRPTNEAAKPWIKLLAGIGWLFIVIGVVGEGYFEARVASADVDIQAFEHSRVGDIGNEADAVAAKLQNAFDKATTATTKSGSAVAAAQVASAAAESASDRSKHADLAALNAKKEADSFERDIVSAKQQASDAEAHLAEAVRRATEATVALNRLTLPRVLTHISELADTLRPFKGTEYIFSGVFGDQESQDLLRQID